MTKHILRRAKSLGGDASFLRDAATLEAQLKILEITQLRILDAQQSAPQADPRASVLKLKGVELRQAASELLMRQAGIEALRVAQVDGRTAPDEADDPTGTIAPNYFILRAASIYGGSSEIQKTIIAKRILGL